MRLDTYIDVNEKKCSRQKAKVYLTFYLLSLLFSLKGFFFVIDVLVYNWCWNTSSAFYRQSAFGEHSSLPASCCSVFNENRKVFVYLID